jgi:glycosyltransferase involved in cell wall biosynthesis
MIKVAIVLNIKDDWLGGASYYRNLAHAVYCVPKRSIEFVIFTDTKSDDKYLQDFKHLKIIRTTILDSHSPAWIIRKLFIHIFKNDFLLIRLLKKNKIDVMSHSGWLGRYSKIPAIGWIQDFQHMHLPNFFTKKECKTRNRAFLDLCELCSKVIVSSQDSLKDLLEFSPKSKDKAIVLRFAVPFKQDISQLTSLAELQDKYGFKEQFLLVPNQFWAHKNHKVVIEALGILKKQNIKIIVLATGNTFDPRQPNFFSSLENLIASENVKEEFKILGMISKNHLDSLFVHAKGIINPSLFEGWSTSVEEAKVLGKKILLSNISIHQEQNPEHGIYFDPHKPSQLAQLMQSVFSAPDDLVKAFISNDSVIKYGETYQDIIEQLVRKDLN